MAKVELLEKRWEGMLNAVPRSGSEVSRSLNTLSQRGSGLFLTILGLIIIWGLSFLAETAFRRKAVGLRAKPGTVTISTFKGRLIRTFLILIIDLADLLIFGVTALVLTLIIYHGPSSSRLLTILFLATTIFARIFFIISKAILAPGRATQRLFPNMGAAAIHINNGFKIIMIEIGFFWAVLMFFKNTGMTRDVILFLNSLAVWLIILTIMVIVWRYHRPIANVIREGGEPGSDVGQGWRPVVARGWSSAATLYVFIMGVLWQSSILSGEGHQVIRFLSSFLMLPLFIVLDRIGDRLITMAFNREKTENKKETPKEKAVETETETQALQTDETGGKRRAAYRGTGAFGTNRA